MARYILIFDRQQGVQALFARTTERLNELRGSDLATSEFEGISRDLQLNSRSD